MAQDIRVNCDLWDHPKYQRLTAQLGDIAGLALIRLWSWAGRYKMDGKLGAMSDAEIATAAKWQGDPAEFVGALREAGTWSAWLDKDGDLHDWPDHQPFVVKTDQRREQASMAGKAAWKNRKKIPADAPARTKPITHDSLYSPEFEAFWEPYPRKVGKGAAYRSWMKMPETEQELLSKCLTALEWQKKSEDWAKENGQYVPHPATYLNGRRFDDEPPPAPAPIVRMTPKD